MSVWHKRWRAAFFAAALLVFGCVCSFAQTYHIYRPLPRLLPDHSPKEGGWTLGLEAAVSVVSAETADAEGNAVADFLSGASVTWWKNISSGFAVGLKGEALQARGTENVLSLKLTKQSAVLLLKWTLTPDTMTRFYILAGGGVTFCDGSSDFFRAKMSRTGAVWKAAFGSEIPLGSSFFLTGSAGVSYEPSSWRNFALHASGRVRKELSAGVAAYW